MKHSKHIRRRVEDSLTLFISRDTYISNDVDEQSQNNGKENLLRAGTGTGQAKSQTLLYYDDSQLVIPEGHSVTDIELCLFHYFIDSLATSKDPFLVNTITEIWDESKTTWKSKPSIGDIIAEVHFNSTGGKECIHFNDNSSVEKLRDSYGVVISGGASSKKNERYFTSSEWTSKSRNVEYPETSLVYHPHWVVKTKERNIATIVNGGNAEKEKEGIQESPVTDIMQYIIIIFSVLIGIIIAILAFYCWRERREKREKVHRDFDEETRSGSFDEIHSSHDSRLNDLFRTSESSQVSSVTWPQQVSRIKSMNKSRQQKGDLRANGRQRNEKGKRHPNNENQDPTEGDNDRKNNSSTSNPLKRSKKLMKGRLSRHKKEKIPFSGTLHSNSSISTNMIEGSSDPSLINRVCLKIVNRKECDIDYVAPGVASVVENQCANDDLR